MVRRTKTPAAVPIERTAEATRAGIGRLQRRIDDLQALDIGTISTGFEDSLKALEAGVAETLARVFGQNTPDFIRYQDAASLQRYIVPIFVVGPGSYEPPTPVGDIRAEVGGNRDRAVSLLRQAIRGLQEDLADAQPAEAAPAAARRPASSRNVFVVHGHDEASLQTLARFLEHLELEAMVLKEQPDQGRTIIEKFEACASDVAFAVVLMTPDDLGGAKSDPNEAQARARQNVVFELGYFAGKLGRGKVCLLRSGKLEMPSDLYGVIYTDLDASEGWKLKLGRELRAAGLDVDMNRCC